MDDLVRKLLVLWTLSLLLWLVSCATPPTATKIIIATPSQLPTTKVMTPSPHPTTAVPTSSPSPSPVPTTDLSSIGPFRPIAQIDVAALGKIFDLVAQPDDTLWLRADRKIIQLIGDSWIDYLSDFKGYFIGMDDTNRIWIISDDTSEISSWNGEWWDAYGPEDGWQPVPGGIYGGIYGLGGVTTDQNGHVWISTNYDLRRFNGEHWVSFTTEDIGYGSSEDQDISTEFNLSYLEIVDQVWVGSCYWTGPGPLGGDGVRWFDGQSWHGHYSPVDSGCVEVISDDTSGNVWIGVDGDLWRYERISAGWTHFPSPEPPIGNRFGFVTDIAMDPNGDPWPEIAACGGGGCFGGVVRYHLQQGTWIQIGDADTSGYESHLLFDNSGKPWLFKIDGIYRVMENIPRLIAEMNIQKVTMDSEGRIIFIAPYEDKTLLWELITE